MASTLWDYHVAYVAALDEAVVEVEAQEAGGEADVPAHGVLHEAPHGGLRLGAGPVVEVEGQARGQRRPPRVAVAVRCGSR